MWNKLFLFAFCCSLIFLFKCDCNTHSVDEEGTILIKMVKINVKGKSFMMGSDRYGERPVHKVKFDYNFLMSTTEVTQNDYRILMGGNPADQQGDSLPVKKVTWCDAILFCNALSKRDSLNPVYEYSEAKKTGITCHKIIGLRADYSKNGYRLPSESEWEYACRGGTTTENYWGDDNTPMHKYAWYLDNSNDSVHAVGSKRPNDYGLYDMIGNVAEWCQDTHHNDYEDAPVDGSPLEGGAGPNPSYSIRGFKWNTEEEICRSSGRRGLPPSIPYSTMGIRLVSVP